jgi:hypothetical protein
LALQDPSSPLVQDPALPATIERLNYNILSCLNSLRDELSSMESVVNSLNELFFQVDILLAEPSFALKFGLNPAYATQQLGGIVGSAQEELERRRELLNEFPYDEEMSPDSDTGRKVEEWAEGWKELKEVDESKQTEMDDLSSALAGWNS